MTKDCLGPTVGAVNFLHGRGPVFYASLPGDSEARHRLVATLWDHFAAMESPGWQGCQAFSSAALPIQVVRGLLGRPQLLRGGHPGPAISFSEGGGKVWAALCGDGADIGIDVAGADEFPGAYPIHRVFHPPELEHALTLAGGELAAASALLWSVKEAVVKALGCAFHLVEPRQITVYPAVAGAAGGDGEQTFPVGLSGKARERFPLASSRSLWVHSLPQRRQWLSIAHLQRRPTAHE
jgi:phosphopantetheinyl transferase (holo-ACP synthase)